MPLTAPRAEPIVLSSSQEVSGRKALVGTSLPSIPLPARTPSISGRTTAA